MARRMFVPLTALSTLVVVGSVTACSRAYGSEDEPPPVEAGTAPTDASTVEASADAGDVTVSCPGGERPLLVYRPRALTDGIRAETSGGAVVVEGSEAEGRLRSSGVVPTSFGDAMRAFVQWQPAVTGLRSHAVVIADFDMSADYAGAKIYAELGCGISVRDGASTLVTARLATQGPAVSLAGRLPSDGGTSGYRVDGLGPFPVGAVLSTRHGRIELEVGVSAGSARASIEGPIVVTPVPPLPSFDSLSFECGVFYADSGDGKVLTVRTKNMSFIVCP